MNFRRTRAHLWAGLAAAAACSSLLIGLAGSASAAVIDEPADRAVRATVTRYLEGRCDSMLTLCLPDRESLVSPTDETAASEAFDDLDVVSAREVGCGWNDYTLRTEYQDVRIAGSAAEVTVVEDVDYHYRSSPQIDSGIYDVVYRFRLRRTADGWKITAIDSDNDDYRRFKQSVAGRVTANTSTRAAADAVKVERMEAIAQLATQVSAMDSSETAQSDSFSPAAFDPMAAASYSYSGSKGAVYAQRFATGTPRLFYYVSGANCTNFVSQCVWAGYGGYVSGNDTLSKQNISNKVRMVSGVWQGGLSGGGGTSNWESVSSLWSYATNSTKTRGPMATGYNNNAKYTGIAPADVRVGNILQLRYGSSGSYLHSTYVSIVVSGPGEPASWSRIYVCQNSDNVLNKMASDVIADWGGSSCYMRRLVFRSATFDK